MIVTCPLLGAGQCGLTPLIFYSLSLIISMPIKESVSMLCILKQSRKTPPYIGRQKYVNEMIAILQP